MLASRSGPLAAWTRAWLVGRLSLDEAIDAVSGDDAPHVVVGLAAVEALDAVDGRGAPFAVRPDPATSSAASSTSASTAASPASDRPRPLRDALVLWRRSGAEPSAVLPAPGDIRGLPGPAAFRAAALDRGEAVVAGSVGLVPTVVDHAPSSAPTSVTWQAFVCEPLPPDPETLREAQHELTTAIRESASALLAADVAGASRAVADLLGDARRAGDRLNLPPGHPGPAVALLSQAERLQAVLDIVSADPHGGAVDRTGVSARHDALRPLATAVRRARLAAYNA